MSTLDFKQLNESDLIQLDGWQQALSELAWSTRKIKNSIATHDVCWAGYLNDTGLSKDIKKTFEARIEGKIVALAVVTSVLDECTLLLLCVAKPYQTLGYGRTMLMHLITQAKKARITTIFLEVRTSNKNAISLYETVGFNKVGTRKAYYASENGREDGLVYSLFL